MNRGSSRKNADFYGPFSIARFDYRRVVTIHLLGRDFPWSINQQFARRGAPGESQARDVTHLGGRELQKKLATDGIHISR